MSKSVECDKCSGTGRINLTPLAELRLSKKLTQKDVADALGMQRSAYAMVELGKANMLANRVPILAELYSTSADHILYLMYGDYPKSANQKLSHE